MYWKIERDGSVKYEVIVVGAGHAGCEAALAAARLGAKTLIITISPDTIGAMSCNPAIGGPAAKSHLVRELDALGGEMARVIDQTYLNIRRLNETRGPAVTALRAQADKKLYQAEMTLRLEREPNLTVKQGLVTELMVEDNRVTGVALKSGRIYQAATVILATGTFLGGQIVIGNIKYSGGRQGEPAALELSESLSKHGIKLRRFQTATPPRIHQRSVDFSKISAQPLQDLKWGFSWDGLKNELPQTPCWLTQTTPETIALIREKINFSPIKSGAVVSQGPHFCPSIDRKVINFPEKTDHLIFLEPEGIYTEEMYLLGLTTAMPEVIQEEILRTIPGLDKVEIIRPGYAVEYDCLAAWQFFSSLESKQIANLFTAGQLNGTSGYEEAAVQGLIAGVNAVRKLRQQAPFIPDRTNSYIGVLIDDLATKEVHEPYRMMTSLAEFRLFLRLDNSLARLISSAENLGILNQVQLAQRKKLLSEAEELADYLKQTKIKPQSNFWQKRNMINPERGVRLNEIPLRPELSERDLADDFPEILNYSAPMREYLWNETKLAGYLSRQQTELAEMQRLNEIMIPVDFDFIKLPKISEMGIKLLRKVRPLTLGQALRIPELTAADQTVLLLFFSDHYKNSTFALDKVSSDSKK